MSDKPTAYERLMESDVTVPLAVAALVLCGVGFWGGPSLMLKTFGYGVGVLLIAWMAMLLIFGSHVENRSLRKLQKTYGGRSQRSFFNFRPFYRFSHRGHAVSLQKYSGGRNRPGLLQVTVEWQNSPRPFTIRPQGVFDSLRKIIGSQDVQIGRKRFDDAYLIHADDPEEIRRLLDWEVQRQILDVPEQKRLVIRLHGEALLVRAQYYSLTSDLEEFTAAALRVFDAFERSAGEF